MADITHGTWIKDGKAVDAVYSNGQQIYGRNLLVNTSGSATNRHTAIPGATTNITGEYSKTDSYEQVVANSNFQELFYRPMLPIQSNLYGLIPGKTYTYSGSASHTSGELKFRAQYGFKSTDWSRDYLGDLGIPVSDGSVFTPFSYTFTIPVGATGVYVSLQNFDYAPDGLFRFKDMKLEVGGQTPYSLAPEDLLKSNLQ